MLVPVAPGTWCPGNEAPWGFSEVMVPGGCLGRAGEEAQDMLGV